MTVEVIVYGMGYSYSNSYSNSVYNCDGCCVSYGDYNCDGNEHHTCLYCHHDGHRNLNKHNTIHYYLYRHRDGVPLQEHYIGYFHSNEERHNGLQDS